MCPYRQSLTVIPTADGSKHCIIPILTEAIIRPKVRFQNLNMYLSARDRVILILIAMLILSVCSRDAFFPKNAASVRTSV